jgi:hypothetical protein
VGLAVCHCSHDVADEAIGLLPRSRPQPFELLRVLLATVSQSGSPGRGAAAAPIWDDSAPHG